MTTNAAPSAPPGWYQASDGQWYPTTPLPPPPMQHAPGEAFARKPSTNMLGAVLATLFCFFPLGVVAIIFAAQVDSKWIVGDRAGAVHASKMARLFANLALGVAVLFVGGFIAVMSLGKDTSQYRADAYRECMARPYTTASDCRVYLR